MHLIIEIYLFGGVLVDFCTSILYSFLSLFGIKSLFLIEKRSDVHWVDSKSKFSYGYIITTDFNVTMSSKPWAEDYIKD